MDTHFQSEWLLVNQGTSNSTECTKHIIIILKLRAVCAECKKHIDYQNFTLYTWAVKFMKNWKNGQPFQISYFVLMYVWRIVA